MLQHLRAKVDARREVVLADAGRVEARRRALCLLVHRAPVDAPCWLLTVLHRAPPALSREEETQLLRSCLGVGRHPDATEVASPEVIPYGLTTVNELADFGTA